MHGDDVLTGRTFLIATWDGGGNTNPAYNLGTRLRRRGHRVRIIGWPAMAERTAAAKLEFAAYRSMEPWPQGVPLDDDWDRMERLLLGSATGDDIAAEARECAADVLVLDCMLSGGFAAARELGVPHAALVHILYAPFVHEWGDGAMHTSVSRMLDAADAVLLLEPPGFDGPLALPGNTVCVGPILDGTAPGTSSLDTYGLEMLDGSPDPWVLLSLSTTLQGQLRALPGMLDALSRLPVRVLLTLGGVVSAGDVDAPANVTVRDFVPHELVLPHMSAVVTHAGLSTITAALAAGVPMVCIPQGRDQPLNAASVDASGVGRTVLADSPPAELAAAVEAVLQAPAMRSAAQRFAAAIARLGRGGRATDLVERLSRPGGRRSHRVLCEPRASAATESVREQEETQH